MSSFKLSIKSPCSENWNSFEKKGNVGFCTSCQKNVIDFTNYSDKQVTDFFRNNDSSICGRFRENQMKAYEIPRRKNRYEKTAAILTLGALSLASAAHAQSDSHIISGHVIIASENSSMPGASVAVKGTNVQSFADADGNFRFLYYGEEKEITLVISFIGMVPEERQVDLIDDSFAAGTIALSYDDESLKEFTYVAGYVCIEKPKSEKIENSRPWFKRLFRR